MARESTVVQEAKGFRGMEWCERYGRASVLWCVRGGAVDAGPAQMTESSAALASSHAEQGEKTIEDVSAKMGMDKEEEQAQDEKKETLMAAVLASLGQKLDFDNEAKLVQGRAAIADGHAKNQLETAARHRDEVRRGLMRCLCRLLRGGYGAMGMASKRGLALHER